jgi:hypothetical protein
MFEFLCKHPLLLGLLRGNRLHFRQVSFLKSTLLTHIAVDKMLIDRLC